MLSEYHQSNPACTFTTHPPQVAFCFEVEFQPANEDEFLPVPVTSSAEAVVEVAFAVPFTPTSNADTMPEVGEGPEETPVLLVAFAPIEPPVPTNGGFGIDAVASSIAVEFLPLNLGGSVGDDTEGLNNGAKPVPKEAGDGFRVPAGTCGKMLGLCR
jgi:hypothetical protein